MPPALASRPLAPNNNTGPRRPSDGPETNYPPSKRQKRADSDVSQTSSKPSVRRKTACQTCRLRKVKCDGVRPVCGLCKAADSTCEYTDLLPERLTLESVAELLSGKLDQIQDRLGALEQSGSPADQTGRRNSDKRPSASEQSLHSPLSTHATVTEPSKDFLQIPAHRTTADSVLQWEIFEGQWPQMALISVLFTPEAPHRDDVSHGALHTTTGGLVPPNEEQIPVLVDKFLQNVHTKNPVLDVERLVRHARLVAVKGLGWDEWSCLVLMASALGAVARPFVATFILSPIADTDGGLNPTWNPDTPSSSYELQLAESCFILACRRLGCVKFSIIGAQCYFFAGVYLMYTLRPLLSWQYFIQASQIFQLYLKTTHGLAADVSHLGQLPIYRSNTQDVTQRRLEESMYWSCFKSESEFRVELPLPQSELSNYAHPNLFPSPPSPPGASTENAQHPPVASEHEFGLHRIGSDSIRSPSLPSSELRQHAKQLCNEEESWYYYLTEIALRRIGNRVINTFFGDGHIPWREARQLLPIAREFETQVSAWSANLPTAMQHWEMSEAIRAPTRVSLSGGTENPVTRELSWATDNRLLEMRSWLYQPFMYYLIHQLPTAAPLGTGDDEQAQYVTNLPPDRDAFVNAMTNASVGFSTEDATLLFHFIASGIECYIKILDVRSLRHRHHGLWYDLRSTMCASLILLAVVKSGHANWIPGGPTALWGQIPSSMYDYGIGGKIGHVLAEFDFWSEESPDMVRHREILVDLTQSVQRSWSENRQQQDG